MPASQLPPAEHDTPPQPLFVRNVDADGPPVPWVRDRLGTDR